MMAAADCRGPYAPDLDPAEQSARLRAFPVRPAATPARARNLCRLLARVETELAALEPDRRVLDALPSNDKRQVRARYATLARAA